MVRKSQITQILILAFICSAFGQSTIERGIINKLTLYSQWRVQNPRVFINDDEKIYRQLVFLDNLEQINQHNADPKKTFQMALTPFSDITEDEFAKKMLTEGVDASEVDQQESNPNNGKELPQQTIKTDDDRKLEATPLDSFSFMLSQIDWRSRGAVTAVKNQGSCGSCWAFSASGVMESFNYIKNHVLKEFSQQQIIDCVNSSLGYRSNGCAGGYPQDALHYASKYGIIQSSQYPYVGETGTCQITRPTTGYYPITYKKIVNTVIALKTALNYAPVSVAVDGTKFQFYTSGIFNSCPTVPKATRGLLAVGYDSAGNWILKSSFGVAWGEAGYMRLKAGNTCGIISNNNNYSVVA